MITEHGVVPIKGGQYKVLSGGQVQLLHDKTIELLETVGIKNLHAEARELMKSRGCVVDDDRQVVKIPGETLMRYVRLAPSKITLYGIDPRYDVRLDDS